MNKVIHGTYPMNKVIHGIYPINKVIHGIYPMNKVYTIYWVYTKGSKSFHDKYFVTFQIFKRILFHLTCYFFLSLNFISLQCDKISRMSFSDFIS